MREAEGFAGGPAALDELAEEIAELEHRKRILVAQLARIPSESAIFRMVLLMGALGGMLHLCSSLAIFVVNRDLKRSWVVYYLLMAVEGAGLALLVFLPLRVGVLTPSAGGATSAESLNLLSIHAFAGLTGLFSKQALKKLGEIFSTVFGQIRAKDPASSDGD